MPHSKSRNRRPLWIRELGSDMEILKLNLADPEWPTLDAIGTAIRPRIRLAWGIHSLGMALLRVATRLDWACPSSFEEFYQDGLRQGRREVVQLWVTRQTDMETIGQLVIGLGMDTNDVIGHLGLSSEAAR